jgi:DNA-binding response OmpR family regulator
MATILIVEDTDLQTNLLIDFLRESHSVIGTADTPAEAVRLAMTKQPDAVLMDLKLRIGTGFDATAEIKAARPDTPVIISTVKATDALREEAADVGADAYLRKPYTQEELLEKIQQVLS